MKYKTLIIEKGVRGRRFKKPLRIIVPERQNMAEKRQSRSQRLFPMQRDEVVELWKTAREKTDIDITPQKLRQWFCSEMLRLSVSETYVDAFCGRVPKSVLARHYTDFSPDKLKDIYEKAKINLCEC